MDDTEVKTEWYPKAGISETLTNDVVNKRAHRYAECSNNGLCNRRRGECECFPGYEGSSCQRRSCPTLLNGKSCTGHGICLSSEAYLEELEQSSTNTNTKVTGWELDKFYTCKCDKDWEGITCSNRKCPKAVDPVTYGKIKSDYYFKLSGEKNIPSHYYKITYDGIIYYSDDFIERVLTPDNNLCKDQLIDFIDVNTATLIQEEIRLSFSKIPPLSNSVIEITCDDDDDDIGNGNNIKKSVTIHIKPEYIDITKLTHNNSGDDETVDIELHYINDSNTQIKAKYSYTNSKGESKDVSNILANQKTCSDRGLCNGMTGLCECFAGYYGASCENQRSLAI